MNSAIDPRFEGLKAGDGRFAVSQECSDPRHHEVSAEIGKVLSVLKELVAMTIGQSDSAIGLGKETIYIEDAHFFGREMHDDFVGGQTLSHLMRIFEKWSVVATTNTSAHTAQRKFWWLR